jgi:hypothetical protein
MYLQDRPVNCKSRPVTALIECNDERGEGTSLRSEVKKLSATSHQKLRIGRRKQYAGRSVSRRESVMCRVGVSRIMSGRYCWHVAWRLMGLAARTVVSGVEVRRGVGVLLVLGECRVHL